MILLSIMAIVVCILGAGFYAGVEMGFYRTEPAAARAAHCAPGEIETPPSDHACVQQPMRS